MGQLYPELDDRLSAFITSQPMFFVATAPCLDESGEGGDRISDSCGYAVPIMDLAQERDLLTRWSERRSADDLAAYRLKHNATSIDGLPALS